MEVILSQDVERIGRVGQVVKVKDGFARNFLFPNKLAVPMNTGNLKRLELDKQKKEQEAESILKEARQLREKLAVVSLTLPMLTQEDESLYGSISAHDIALALKEDGIEIDKHMIELIDPIKKLGIYEVPIRLHAEVTAKVKLWVVKK